MDTNIIGISANGIEVFEHPEGHSHRLDLNEEAISKIELPVDSTFVRTTVNLGRIIGKDHLVETDEHDTIVWLRRGNRPGKSRMVLKEADDTSMVTVVLCVCNEPADNPASALNGKWVLVTLFEGKPGEREPFDKAFADSKNPEGLKKAKEFWSCHALVPTEEELEKILRVEMCKIIHRHVHCNLNLPVYWINDTITVGFNYDKAWRVAARFEDGTYEELIATEYEMIFYEDGEMKWGVNIENGLILW